MKPDRERPEQFQNTVNNLIMFAGTMKAVAGVLGLTGVALGAFGAHALKAKLYAAGTIAIWETGITYHLTHAVALLAVCALNAPSNEVSPRNRVVFWAWSLGTLFFSGSLYVLALGGPRWIGPITPLGGLGFLVGWLCVLWPERRRTDNP